MSRAPAVNSPPASDSRGLAIGLKILNHLQAEGRAMTLADISEFASVGRPSVLRLLRTLEHLGYIVRDKNKAYRIDVAWPSGGSHDRLSILRNAARGPCHELHSAWGETVSVACLFDDHIRVVDVLESPKHIRMSNFPGRILQPYASSLGKAIAAFQEASLQEKLLDSYGIYPLTGNTLTDRQAIQGEYAAIRERGYAEDREETVEGGYCIGAPVEAMNSRVMSAVSVSTPRFRMTAKHLEALPIAVKEAAAKISAALQAELRKS